MLIYINSLFYGLVFSENAFYGAFANNSIQLKRFTDFWLIRKIAFSIFDIKVYFVYRNLLLLYNYYFLILIYVIICLFKFYFNYYINKGIE